MFRVALCNSLYLCVYSFLTRPSLWARPYVHDLIRTRRQQFLGQQGSAIIVEKYRDAIHGDETLPKVGTKAVQDGIPFCFSVNESTTLRKAWEIGPV